MSKEQLAKFESEDDDEAKRRKIALCRHFDVLAGAEHPPRDEAWTRSR